MINRKVNEFRKNERVWWGEYRRITGRTISTLGRGSSMIVRIGEPKRVGGRGVDFNDTIILDPRPSVDMVLPVHSVKYAQWKRIVPSSLDLKVCYPIGIFCSRQIERYQNHENRTSVTYSKLIQFYLITLVKVKCQGHFSGLFCVWSYVFYHMREMVGLLWRSR